MDQTHHALRYCHGNSRGNQRALARLELDVAGTEQIHPGIALVGLNG